MRLTDLAIRKLPSPEKGQKTYWDDALPAFGVRVGARSKSFVIMYGKKRQLRTLGRYPALSLSDARRDAKRLLATVGEQKPSTAYTDARETYLSEIERRLRPNTVRQYAYFLNLFDFAGDVGDVTRQDLLPYLTRHQATMTFKVFFNWCIANDLTDRNPLVGARINFKQPRSRVLLPEEIQQIWPYEDPPFTNILKVLLLTGQRRSEIASLKSEWIGKETITFPSTITKNKREHTIPYGTFTKQYLQPFSFNGWSKSKARLDKHVEIPHWTIHDLRRTFATIHAELGTPIHVTEKLLNHSSGSLAGVAGIYNRHTYLPEMKKAVETYEQHIDTLVNT